MEMEMENKPTKVVIDNTGSVPVGKPHANLKKFNKKSKIVKTFVQDSALQPSSPPAPTLVHKSLMETESTDCPNCKKGEARQDHPVVINPSSMFDPNPHEVDIREEQQDAVNYLIKPVANSLSIKETHLSQASESLKEAEGAHERFHEFKEQAQNQPLIPHHLQQ